MTDIDKTKEQLVQELEMLRARVAELEQVEVEHKRVEEALQASETRYRRLFETAKDGILILDADTGKIADVNPFLIDMLGYSHEDLMGKTLWEIGPFKDIEASRSAFTELQSKEYIRYEDLPLEAKDGRRVLDDLPDPGAAERPHLFVLPGTNLGFDQALARDDLLA